MNERHLFRAKEFSDDGTHAGWVQGHYTKKVICTRDGAIKVVDIIEFICRVDGATYSLQHEIDPTTLSQCTGLQDKNGKLIFEEDIVFIDNHSTGDIATVECRFVKEQMAWLYYTHDFPDCPDYIGKYTNMVDNWRTYEVIGNIHDNPELLEVQDEY